MDVYLFVWGLLRLFICIYFDPDFERSQTLSKCQNCQPVKDRDDEKAARNPVDVGLRYFRVVGSGKGPAYVAGSVPDMRADGKAAAFFVVDESFHYKTDNLNQNVLS